MLLSTRGVEFVAKLIGQPDRQRRLEATKFRPIVVFGRQTLPVGARLSRTPLRGDGFCPEVQRTTPSRARYPGHDHRPGPGSSGYLHLRSHIENHGDLLSGAILWGTLGAIPGLDEDRYDAAIQQLYTLATGPNANAPSPFFGQLLMGFNAPFTANVAYPTGSEWRTRDAEKIRRFQSDPLCGKPFSNTMTYSVIRGSTASGCRRTRHGFRPSFRS